MSADLHEQDFHAWALQQAGLIREGRFAELDYQHLEEEIESMGASERRELVNRLGVLLAHLLKWQYQPERRGSSWRLTIEEQRQRAARVLRQNPSLKPRLGEFLVDAYQDARLIAARETGMDKRAFPDQCPYACALVLDPDFYPGGA